jgi:hypothetical protein
MTHPGAAEGRFIRAPTPAPLRPTPSSRSLAPCRRSDWPANRNAAAARDAELAPVLRELQHLSSRAAAGEIERRGLGKLSYKTHRARSRSVRAGPR